MLNQRHFAQVLRIQKPALEAILERLKDGLPIHARGLHPDQRHPELRQPRSELREPGERRPERSRLLVPAAATLARDADRRHNIVAMHVESRAPHYITSTVQLPSDGN